jgi:hypothetical protein
MPLEVVAQHPQGSPIDRDEGNNLVYQEKEMKNSGAQQQQVFTRDMPARSSCGISDFRIGG